LQASVDMRQTYGPKATPTLGAILLAGGSGTRFNPSQNKLLALLNGKPVLHYSLNAMAQVPAITHWVVVCHPQAMVHYQPLIQALTSPTLPACMVVPGGETRRHSVANGLAALPTQTDWVLIHDAARPLITSHSITQLLQQFNGQGGCSLAAPVTDTIKQQHPATGQLTTLDRQTLWAMQTPQLFEATALRHAHQHVAITQPVTDDMQLLELAGYTALALVPNTAPNLKLTTPQDLPLLSYYLQEASAK
jgi:2-C-methyl-D-erythritol 4-phosphate cytidylyltransferase